MKKLVFIAFLTFVSFVFIPGTSVYAASRHGASGFHHRRSNGLPPPSDSTSTPPVTPPDPVPPVPPVTPPPSPVTSNLILNPSVESQTGGIPDNWFTDVEGTTVASFSLVRGILAIAQCKLQ